MSYRAFVVTFVLIAMFASPAGAREFKSWDKLEDSKFTAITTMKTATFKVEASGFYRFQAHEENKRSTYLLVPTKWKATHEGKLRFESVSQKVAYDPGHRYSYKHEYHFEHVEECEVDLDKLPDSPVWKTGIEIIITDDTRSGGAISYVVNYFPFQNEDSNRINPYMNLRVAHASHWKRTGLEASQDAEGVINVEPVDPRVEPFYRQYPMLAIGFNRTPTQRTFGVGEVPGWHHSYDPHKRYLPRLNWKDLTATGRFSIPVQQDKDSKYGAGGLGSVSFDTDWKLQIGHDEPEPTLEPVDPDEIAWLPKPGDKRKFLLTLDDPGRYEAIRFRLENVSQHPGIATNAGNHARNGGECEDCDCSHKQVEFVVRTKFDGRDFPRFYRKYGDCPLDTAPDLYFDTFYHDQYEAGGEKVSKNLHSEKCTQLTLADPMLREYEVTVSAMDYAAAGMLFADVKVDGVWRPAAPQGDTARGNGLQLPLDADKNKLPDVWQDLYATATDPKADIDAIPAGKYHGDGLTNLEEYRGVFSRGVHARLHPYQKDVFAHAYNQSDYDIHLDKVAGRYATQNLHLHPLNADEFEGEVVNYNSGKDVRLNRQYLSVIEDATTMTQRGFPKLHLENGVDVSWAGKAELGPQRLDHNTIVLKFGGNGEDHLRQGVLQEPIVDPGAWAVLGHELGHQMGIYHHGDSDFKYTISQLREKGVEAEGDADTKRLVATQGGEHSGDPRCFMCYHAATFRIDFAGKYRAWNHPSGVRSYFCTSNSAQDYNKEHGVGNTTYGNCLSQIRLATPSDQAPNMSRREVVAK